MEVSKLSQADPSAARAATPAGTAAGTATTEPTNTDTEYSSAAPVMAAADFADIRPLDLAGALQILVAEVQAGLDASLERSSAPNVATLGPGTPNAAVTGLTTANSAAHNLVDLFLRALPEDVRDPPAWSAALIEVQTTMQASMDRALSVVAAWRDVPPPVVDAAKETHALVFEALADEPPSPLWLRPEWMGLAPLFQRFRRRRRNVRRHLSDPDFPLMNLDQYEGFR